MADIEQNLDAPADTKAWVACLAGALTERQYREVLATAGFVNVSIEESHVLQPGFASVIVRAAKAK